MSERRCGVHLSTDACDGGTGCSAYEPQEGASSVGSSAGTGTVGAPSCDSETIADRTCFRCGRDTGENGLWSCDDYPNCKPVVTPKLIREWLAAKTLLPEHAVDALLRMVDELQADREALGRKNTRIKDNLRETERERDELRAKLAEREKLWAEQTVMRCDLQAKLAEAEKKLTSDWYLLCWERAKDAEKRAEAAEARVSLYQNQAESRGAALQNALARVKELESHRCPHPHDNVEGVRRDRLGKE